MNTQHSILNNRIFKQALLFLLTPLLLTGCPLEGDDGKSGTVGLDGLDGINCWDSNSNGINDPEEDINADGVWDVKDCTFQTQVTQNPDADFNHQHICEALANLGEYPTGCPSSSHTNPIGTLTEIGSTFDVGDGQNAVSCNLEPNNGLLSVEPRYGEFYWILEGGFIANTATIPLQDELGDTGKSCFNLCQADSECIASFANSSLQGGQISYTCSLFHHSDTVEPWARLCSNEFADCVRATGVLQSAQRWSTICP